MTLTTMHPETVLSLALAMAGDVIQIYLSGDRDKIYHIENNGIAGELRRAIHYLNDADPATRVEGRRIIGSLVDDGNAFPTRGAAARV